MYYSLLGPSSVWSELSSSRIKSSEFESSIEYSQGPARDTWDTGGKGDTGLTRSTVLRHYLTEIKPIMVETSNS